VTTFTTIGDRQDLGEKKNLQLLHWSLVRRGARYLYFPLNGKKKREAWAEEGVRPFGIRELKS